MLCKDARDIRKVDGHIAQVLSSFGETDADDLAVGLSHKEAAGVHLCEDFRADQGFRAVPHRMLEIEIQVLQIAGDDAVSYRFRQATWHAHSKRQAQRASIRNMFHRLR